MKISLSVRSALAALSAGLFVLFGSACSTPAAKTANTPLATDDPAIRAQLRSLEDFLDKNVALENELRIHASEIGTEAFRQKHAEWRDFNDAHPDLAKALRSEDRFLLHRAFVRLAGNNRIERHSLARLDEFLDRHPDIQSELVKDPGLILNMSFQTKHPSLAEFLEKHPGLSSAFYQTQERK